MHNSVRGEWAEPDSCDSFNHDFTGPFPEDPNEPLPGWKLLPFQQYDQGLAAGGFRSSAQDLVRMMERLVNRYPNPAEIDAQGWGVAGDGRLGKDGDIPGGNSYMSMYPANYTATPSSPG